jgi:hypothetical protein
LRDADRRERHSLGALGVSVAWFVLSVVAFIVAEPSARGLLFRASG